MATFQSCKLLSSFHVVEAFRAGKFSRAGGRLLSGKHGDCVR
jgi:hypothetical protein